MSYGILVGFVRLAVFVLEVVVAMVVVVVQLMLYCGCAGNCCVTYCTFEIRSQFGAKYLGSEVCDRYSLGLWYRNSGRVVIVVVVLWYCRKLVSKLVYLWGPFAVWSKIWGSEVCDDFALGFCCRNSGSSSRCSRQYCVAVVQETGEQLKVPLNNLK